MPPVRSFSDLCLEVSRRYSDGSSPSADRMSDACSEIISSAHTESSFSFGMVSAEDVIRRLEEELESARLQLKERDEKVSRLSLMQTTVDSEVQELTEKLFQEAYKMVNVAEERRERAEKLQRESKLKVDVLQAEVDALKLIVSASGAGFNHHHNTSPLHQMKQRESHSPFGRLFNSSTPKSSPSSSSSSSITHSTSFPVKTKSSSLPSTSGEKERTVSEEQRKADQIEEIDPVYYREFSAWRDGGHPMDGGNGNGFLRRIEQEDVRPCMHFENGKLADEILSAIRANSLEIEPLNEEKPAVRTCVLSNVPRFCPYRVKTTSSSEWIKISLLARNRIAAVCDFFTYLRYLSLGMVKAGLRDSYFDIIALRKNMALARLGLGFVPKTTVTRPGSGFH
ncbi:hypothetical protein PENTCL1PPCAC_4496 [Pristionchus entomophagus]|uniref:GDP/GTP exchange factor Sec2 N-terminal domain-containing protein n=1 Tax=Pristionchus entomophagus TaxID=358040 RepID=A0AAV5SG87_9BILA|nr:hypothetical protein PENTCL1PPCAC_4496 [Pristionchus entomophagus]